MYKGIYIKAIVKGILIGGIPAICFIVFSLWMSRRLQIEEVATQVAEMPVQPLPSKNGYFANLTSDHDEFEQAIDQTSPEIDITDIPPLDNSDDSEYEFPEYETPASDWPADDPPPELDSSLNQPLREFYRKHWGDPAMRAKWHASVEKSRQRLSKELAVAETAVPAAQDIDREILKLNHFLVKLGAEPFDVGGKIDSDPEVQEVRVRIWELEMKRDEYWRQLEGMASILFDKETDDFLGSWLMEKAGWVDMYLTTTPAWISEFQ